MLTKLEVYGIVAALIVAAVLASYFKGRSDEHRTITTEQLAANAKALQDAATAATARAAADDTARQKAADLISTVDQGIANVNAKFAKVPAVVVDSRGCSQLGDAVRMRWNS